MLEEDIYYFDIKGTVIYDTKTKEMWCEDWEVINEEEYTEAASQLSHYCENFGSKVEEELIGCFKG